jgi:hypothetical protein
VLVGASRDWKEEIGRRRWEEKIGRRIWKRGKEEWE